MATTLNDLKQKKNIGLSDNPESLRTLTPEELRKIAPPKKDDSRDLLLDDLDALDNDLKTRQDLTETQMEEAYNEIDVQMEDAIFDAPVEDADMMSPEETEKMLSEVYNQAAAAINEDENIQAGLKAVESVTNATAPITPESMEIEDFLKELGDGDDSEFDEDDTDVDISEFEDEYEDEETEEEKKMLENMQGQIDTIIKPFNNIIDLKSFTIATKPRSAANVLKTIEPGPTATWVLLDSQVPFTCTALGAVEIENLNPNNMNEQNGRIDALKQMYGTLFKHYTSPNKPEYLEAWLKTISYSDHDNLIFGIYKATYGHSNFITYACDKCKEVKIENVPISDCIKYTDDDTKSEVEHILKYGDPSHKSEIKSTIIQVSDSLAISIKSPSIYNIVFEFGVLDAEFTSKFSNALGIVAYIEDIYQIDMTTMQLVPIRVNEDPQNITKSVKRRIRSKVEILKGLTPDQYQILTTEINKLSKNAERISYHQPAYTCKKCGNVIEQVEMSAQEMLFIRHQLPLIKTL